MPIFKLYTDGASRNNPGPAGAGVVLYEGGEPVLEKAVFLGRLTNNEAEYRALIIGLTEAQRLGIRNLTCYLDANLLVSQLNGSFRIKEPRMKVLFRRAQALAEGFSKIEFILIPREKNVLADKLANKAIDKVVK